METGGLYPGLFVIFGAVSLLCSWQLIQYHHWLNRIRGREWIRYRRNSCLWTPLLPCVNFFSPKCIFNAYSWVDDSIRFD